jgi:hypothetical protein
MYIIPFYTVFLLLTLSHDIQVLDPINLSSGSSLYVLLMNARIAPVAGSLVQRPLIGWLI